MISSAVASSIQLGGGSIFGDSGLTTILFGTISGGITAELTGEDGALRKCPVDIFSERASMRRERQGAATGLVVSALNHTMHKIEQRAYSNKILRDFAEKYFGDTDGFKRSKYTIRAPRGRFVNDEGFFENKEGGTSWGTTNPRTGKIHISKIAFETFGDLYTVVGHETLHRALRFTNNHFSDGTVHATIGEWMIQQSAYLPDVSQRNLDAMNRLWDNNKQFLGIKPNVDWRNVGFTIRTNF